MKNILKKNEDQKLIENQEEIIKNFKYWRKNKNNIK